MIIAASSFYGATGLVQFNGVNRLSMHPWNPARSLTPPSP